MKLCARLLALKSHIYCATEFHDKLRGDHQTYQQSFQILLNCHALSGLYSNMKVCCREIGSAEPPRVSPLIAQPTHQQ